MRAQATAIALALVCASSVAFTQEPPDKARLSTDALAAEGFVAPASVSEASVALPSVEFTSESGESEVLARIGFAGDTEQFALILKAPVNNSGPTSLATLDGLSGRSSLALSYNRMFWSLDLSHDRVREACRHFGKAETCGTSDIKEEDQDEFNRRAASFQGRPWLLGLSARVGRGDFEWVTLEDLAAMEERHNSWSASISLGSVRRFGYVGVRYEYQDAYRASKERSLCVPLDVNDIVECTETATAGPKQTKASIGRIELRRFIGGGRVAINPIYQRDFKAKVDAIDVPVYFISGKDKKGLTGGAAVGWRSDSKHVSFRVFVGATFRMVTLGG